MIIHCACVLHLRKIPNAPQQPAGDPVYRVNDGQFPLPLNGDFRCHDAGRTLDNLL